MVAVCRRRIIAVTKELHFFLIVHVLQPPFTTFCKPVFPSTSLLGHTFLMEETFEVPEQWISSALDVETRLKR